MQKSILYALSLSTALLSTSSFSHESTPAIQANSHAPISIMGDHMHKTGEWMISYRYMSMDMSGNLSGADSVSDNAIVSTQANRFASMPMMPPTLRVVPQTMRTQMHMLGAMYAPSDNLTLMVMLNYLQKEMTLTTYQGMMGTDVLADFNSDTSGVGDTYIGGLYRLFDNKNHHFHVNLSLSIPTGSVNEEGQILTPMNTQPTVKLPYSMQLGSGSYDLIPGLTYTGKAHALTWGVQVLATMRTDDNRYNYRLGDEQKINAWGQYAFADSLSTSLGFEHKNTDEISGMDASIMLPVQTADPLNYGGTFRTVKAGLNWVGQTGNTRGHRLALEYISPLKQDRNGIQMEMDNMLMLGYQKAF